MHLVARETLPEPNSQGNQLPVSPFSFQEAFHTLNNFKCSAPSHYLFLHMASVLGAATSANNWLLEVYPQDTTHCVEYTANINHARRFASFFYDYDKRIEFKWTSSSHTGYLWAHVRKNESEWTFVMWRNSYKVRFEVLFMWIVQKTWVAPLF